MNKERGTETVFFTYEDAVNFCTELANGGLEGLCDCVGAGSSRVRQKCVLGSSHHHKKEYRPMDKTVA